MNKLHLDGQDTQFQIYKNINDKFTLIVDNDEIIDDEREITRSDFEFDYNQAMQIINYLIFEIARTKTNVLSELEAIKETYVELIKTQTTTLGAIQLLTEFEKENMICLSSETEQAEDRYLKAIQELGDSSEFTTIEDYENWFSTQWDSSLLNALKVAAGIE